MQTESIFPEKILRQNLGLRCLEIRKERIYTFDESNTT